MYDMEKEWLYQTRRARQFIEKLVVGGTGLEQRIAIEMAVEVFKQYPVVEVGVKWHDLPSAGK